MNQRQAVFVAIMAILAENNIDFVEGQDVSPLLTKDMRAAVHAHVVNSFKTGVVEFEKTPANAEKMASESKLNSYVSGLISNWIRKDKRFNGGVTYVPKNPGSRAGQGDDQLKTLRQLKKQFAGQPQEALIEKEIAKRVAELAASKAQESKLTPEQMKSLPSSLLETLGIDVESIG